MPDFYFCLTHEVDMIIVRELSKEEIQDACHLLYIEYIKTDIWQFSENNPSKLKVITQSNRKLLVDRITPLAIWFGAYDGNKLVGCIRLFKAFDDVPFEIERYPAAQDAFKQYVVPSQPDIYEGSRACVASEYKGKGILNKLYLSILEYAQKQKSSVFITASNEYIKSILKKVEWSCKKENAFKFEVTDSAPVSFYFASYKDGEITNVIQKLKSLEKTRNRNAISILDALDLVAHIFPAPFYWHDTTGRVLGINTRCLNDMGRTIEQVLGKTPYDFYPKDIADYIWKHSEYVIKSGEVLTQEEYAYDHSGKCIGTYLAIKSPLYDEHGNVIGVLGTSIDITAQKEATRLQMEIVQAHQAEKESLEEFKGLINGVQYLIDEYQSKRLNKRTGLLQTPPNDYNRQIKLSKRESEILYYMSLNNSAKEIAQILTLIHKKSIDHTTVHSIINKQLYLKFDARSPGELIKKAKSLKLIPLIPD